MMFNKGIALAGNLIVDQVKRIDAYPSPGRLTTIREEMSSLGGLVCNCALDLAKLDPTLPLQAIGIIGDDDLGKYILIELAKHPSIDTKNILKSGRTSYTDVMTDLDGNRTFFQYRGANDLFAPEHIKWNNIHADILHIGYLLLLDHMDQMDSQYPTVMCRVLANAKAADLVTSIDVVSEEGDRFSKLIPPVLPYTDYCIVNEVEAERITNVTLRSISGDVLDKNLQAACEKLLDMGVGRWAVIHMPELSCGMGREGEFCYERSWQIPIGFKRSAVGAGDAFASGILYGIYQGWDLQQSIHTAGAIAAFSLSGNGASDAIIDLNNLLLQMEKLQK